MGSPHHPQPNGSTSPPPDAHSFPLAPLQRFSRPGAAIKRPTEVSCFSYDSDHILHHDARGLKYYYTPPLGASLSRGYDSFRKFDDAARDEHIDSLLSSIVRMEKEKRDETRVDFVTWRGMMTKIMTAPYTDIDGFEMNATLFQGTIFIEENKEYRDACRRQQDSRRRPGRGRPDPDLMSYWGYKFETLCMLPTCWDGTSREYIENRENLAVDNFEQYCSVARTGFGDTSLLLAGEVDGIWDAKQTDPSVRNNWVELKTSAEIRGAQDKDRFEKKLNKFWAQSFLLGVPKIIVGFRTNNEEGRLLHIQEFETTKIPSIVRNEGNQSWESIVCINFAADFLNFLKETIATDGVWRIRRKERADKVEVFKVEETGSGQILSQEFIDWRASPEHLEAAKEVALNRLKSEQSER